MKTTNYGLDTITDQFVVSHMTLAWLIAMNIFTFSCLQGNAGPAGSKGALGAKGAKVTLTLFWLFSQRFISYPLYLLQPLSILYTLLHRGKLVTQAVTEVMEKLEKM